MHPVIEKLIAAGPVVTDGAWGTQLQACGPAIGEFPDAWNFTRPERVSEVARAYLNGGSRVILTNTFGANRIRLAENSLAHRVVEINRRGVGISREAADGKAAVFASIGPSGKLLMNGEVNAEEVLAAFTEQARALAEGGERDRKFHFSAAQTILSWLVSIASRMFADSYASTSSWSSRIPAGAVSGAAVF